MDPFAPPASDIVVGAPDPDLSTVDEARLTYLHATAAPKLLFGGAMLLTFGMAALADVVVGLTEGFDLSDIVAMTVRVSVCFAAGTALIAGLQALWAGDEHPERVGAAFDTEELFWQVAGFGVLLTWLLGCVATGILSFIAVG